MPRALPTGRFLLTAPALDPTEKSLPDLSSSSPTCFPKTFPKTTLGTDLKRQNSQVALPDEMLLWFCANGRFSFISMQEM